MRKRKGEKNETGEGMDEKERGQFHLLGSLYMH